MSTINLLPDDYMLRRNQKRANMLCVIMFGVVMAGVAAAALVSEQSVRHTKSVLARVNADYNDASKVLAEVQRLRVTKRHMTTKAKATAALLEKVPRSYVLATVARALPEHSSLLQVDLKPGQVKKAAAATKGTKFDKVKKSKAKGKKKATAADKAADAARRAQAPSILEVTGLAATDVEVANFISTLNDNPLMASVDINYTQDAVIKSAHEGAGELQAREFRVTMKLKPNVDVIDLMEERPAVKTAGTPTEGDKS